jgi:hypothetical protein
MNQTGSRLALGGAGLAAACALVCCSVPLLIVAVPGLALVVGWAAEAMAVGLLVAVILAVVSGVGVALWRRRPGACQQCAGGAVNCCSRRSASPASLS